MRLIALAAVAASTVLALTACEFKAGNSVVHVVKSVGPVVNEEAEVICWEEGAPGTEYPKSWNVLAAVAPKVGEAWLC